MKPNDKYVPESVQDQHSHEMRWMGVGIGAVITAATLCGGYLDYLGPFQAYLGAFALLGLLAHNYRFHKTHAHATHEFRHGRLHPDRYKLIRITGPSRWTSSFFLSSGPLLSASSRTDTFRTTCCDLIDGDNRLGK
ncbi:MAG: hypothetical protein AAFZ38_01265 [Myxococcota bacterium]